MISNIINNIGEEDIHFESGPAKSAPTESQDKSSSESGSDSESGSSSESDELEEGEVQVKSKYAKSKASSKDVKGKVSSKSDVKSKPQEPMDTETAAEYKYVEMPAHKVNVGTEYNKGKCEKRKAVLYASGGKKCKFVDSHMHLYKLQAVSRMQDLDMIMREGPMPSMPVEWQAAIVNYCHRLPTDLAKDLFSEDYHLFYCYGIHPKLAHTVTQKDKRAVMSKVNFDSRCLRCLPQLAAASWRPT